MLANKRKIAAALLLLGDELETEKNENRRRKKSRAPISQIFRSRELEGAYESYFCRYLKRDEKKFKQYVRLPSQVFNDLLSIVYVDLLLEPSNRYINPISPEHQLVLTLR